MFRRNCDFFNITFKLLHEVGIFVQELFGKHRNVTTLYIY